MKEEEVKQRILGMLAEQQEMDDSAIGETLQIPRGMLDSILTSLVEEGRIDCHQEGKAAVYSLV